MRRMQLNLVVFLIALVFTFISQYYLALAVGWGVNASTVIAAGFAGGTLLLGLLSYGIQYQRNKAAFARKQKIADNTDTEQSSTIEIDVPFAQAFDLALDALHSLDGEDIPSRLLLIRSKQTIKIHQMDREIGRIQAGLRARTIGLQDIVDFSRIEIQLQRIDADTTRIRIDSRPTMPLEVYDLARHMHYVNHLALHLREASERLNPTHDLDDDPVEAESTRRAGRSRTQ